MAKLILICGISFAGKSTLGNALLERINAAKFDIDDVKFELYGPDIQDHELSQAQWDGIYEEVYKRIGEHLLIGATVIHDSGNFKRCERMHLREIAQQQGADVITIFVDTPTPIAYQRLLENRAAATRLDVTDEEWRAIVAAMEQPADEEHAIVFRYEDSLADWIEQNFSLLK